MALQETMLVINVFNKKGRNKQLGRFRRHSRELSD